MGLTRLAPTTRAWIVLGVTVALVAGGLLALVFAEGLRGGHLRPVTPDNALFAGAMFQAGQGAGQGPLTFMPPSPTAPAANRPRHDAPTSGSNDIAVLISGSVLALIAVVAMPWLARRNEPRQRGVATAGYRPMPAIAPAQSL